MPIALGLRMGEQPFAPAPLYSPLSTSELQESGPHPV
jgi:hypothetical protein